MTGQHLSSCVRLVVSHTHTTLKRPSCSYFCLSLGMKPAGNKSVPVRNPVAGVVVINTDLKGPGGAFPKSSLAMGCRVGGFKTVYFYLGHRLEITYGHLSWSISVPPPQTTIIKTLHWLLSLADTSSLLKYKGCHFHQHLILCGLWKPCCFYQHAMVILKGTWMTYIKWLTVAWTTDESCNRGDPQ